MNIIITNGFQEGWYVSGTDSCIFLENLGSEEPFGSENKC